MCSRHIIVQQVFCVFLAFRSCCQARASTVFFFSFLTVLFVISNLTSRHNICIAVEKNVARVALKYSNCTTGY